MPKNGIGSCILLAACLACIALLAFSQDRSQDLARSADGAAALSSTRYTVYSIHYSPSRHIIIEQRIYDVEERPYRIWLLDADRRTSIPLQENASDALLSPDDEYMALNVHIMAGTDEVELHKRVKGLRYEEIRMTKTPGEAFHDLLTLYNATTGTVREADARTTTSRFEMGSSFFHTYENAIAWLDSTHLLLSYSSGNGGIGHRNGIKDDQPKWFCIYDVNTGKITCDLHNIVEPVHRTRKINPDDPNSPMDEIDILLPRWPPGK